MTVHKLLKLLTWPSRLALIFILPSTFLRASEPLLKITFAEAEPQALIPSVKDKAGNASDFFRRTDGTDLRISGIQNPFKKCSGFFFAAQDLDGLVKGKALQTLTSNKIALKGATSLDFAVKAAEFGDGWDRTDFVTFNLEFTGGGKETKRVLNFRKLNDGKTHNSSAALVLQGDLGSPGQEVTETFGQFRALGILVPQGAREVRLIVTFQLNSEGESFAIDDLTLTKS